MPSYGTLALSSARRLHILASILLTIISFVALIAVAGGISVAVLEHNDQIRGIAISVAVGAFFSWLFSLLPYLAAQAVARYIEYRIVADSQG